MEKSRIVAPVVLKGSNYLLWARTLKTTLCSHGLWQHILQKEAPLTLADAETSTARETNVAEEAAKWFQEDQLVLSVLQNSLDGSLLEAYSYCETAYELWEMLRNVYGNMSNLLRIFEVKRSLNDLNQGDMEFTVLFGKFRALWAELDMLRPSTADPIVINERKEQDKVFSLLLSLNPSYNELIKYLLREERLPSLEDVCARIQKEQGAQGLFTKDKGEMVMAHKGFYKPDRRKKVWCSHCKKDGHNRGSCYILHPHLRPKE